MIKSIMTIGLISLTANALVAGVIVWLIVYYPNIEKEQNPKNPIFELASQIDDWKKYNLVSEDEKPIFNFESCGNEEFDNLVAKVNIGDVYRLKLNDALTIIYTPNYNNWERQYFLNFNYDNQSFCQAGAIYPKYAFKDKLLWAGVCTVGVLPSKTSPQYKEFQKCIIAEDALEYFIENKE